MTQTTETEVKLARVIRNGVLAAITLLLLSMTTCYTAAKHYDYLDRQMVETRYLVTRPW